MQVDARCRRVLLEVPLDRVALGRVGARAKPYLPPDGFAWPGLFGWFVCPERLQCGPPNFADATDQGFVVRPAVAVLRDVVLNELLQLSKHAIWNENGCKRLAGSLAHCEEFDAGAGTVETLERQVEVGVTLELEAHAAILGHADGSPLLTQPHKLVPRCVQRIKKLLPMLCPRPRWDVQRGSATYFMRVRVRLGRRRVAHEDVWFL